MKIFVKAQPNAKKESLVKLDGINFKIAVKDSPRKGQANRAIAKALAQHFGVPAGNVRLVSGFSSRQKMFEIVE